MCVEEVQKTCRTSMGSVSLIASVSIIQAAFIYLGSSVMRTVPLAPSHLALTVLLSLPVIIFEFARKLWQRLTPRK